MKPTFWEFKLKGEGASRVLGELETEILRLAWARGPLTVREAWESLQENRPEGRDLAYTTVLTVMRRLAAKGFLSNDNGARAHVYAPAISREEFRHLVAERVVDALLDEFAEAAMAQFVDRTGKDDPQRLLELKRLIDARLTEEAAPGAPKAGSEGEGGEPGSR